MSGVYQTLTASLAAGEQRALNITGRFFSIIDGNHPDIRVRIDDSAEMEFDEGLRFRMPDGQMFRKVALVNKSGSTTLDFTVAYGSGYFDDSRLSLVGGALPVEPAGANLPFNMQQDAGAAAFRVEQTGFLTTEGGNITPLQGNKWAGSIPATMSQTVVAAAANLNGIIVHFLKVAGAAGTTTYALEDAVGGSLWHYTTSGANEQAELRDVLIPPGEPLKIYCLNTAYAAVVYEVL
ncbi:hypothetical protein [Pyruvatibacter mobilis]|uniref:hypothetical protein n=1 Tax=Pyruvatibacter mobilis TaxID=1712261 RepID=UPI003BA90B97